MGEVAGAVGGSMVVLSGGSSGFSRSAIVVRGKVPEPGPLGPEPEDGVVPEPGPLDPEPAGFVVAGPPFEARAGERPMVSAKSKLATTYTPRCFMVGLRGGVQTNAPLGFCSPPRALGRSTSGVPSPSLR